MAVREAVQPVDGHAHHRRAHPEEPGGPVREALLINLERHPPRIGTTANAAAHADAVVADQRLPHHAGRPEVALHRSRKRRDVDLGQHRRVDRPGQARADVALELGAEAGRALREVAEGHAGEKEHVGHGAELRVGPRREDDGLGDHECGGADHPPAARPDEQRHGRDERQRRGQQPHHGLRELRKIGVTERLGRSHQVNQAVQGDDEGEDPAHEDSSRQAGGTILPDAGAGRASVTR